MKSHNGKIYDPVFLFMIVAVMLAIGSSFALRSVVSGIGPSSAHAADAPADDSAPGQSLDITSIPASTHPVASMSGAKTQKK